MTFIKSWENKTFRYIYSLTTKKGRDRAGSFIIEGWRFVHDAMATWKVEFVAVSESFAGNDKNKEAMTLIEGFENLVLTDFLFDKLAGTENSQGIIAVCPKRFEEPADILTRKKSNRMYMIAVDINDPGNLGTLIRTADAAGADAVFLGGDCVELYNPKVLRASAGSVYHMPIAENALTTLVNELKLAGVDIYAAHLGGTVYPYNLDLARDCAFMVGNEARGLSEEAASLADVLVKIPIPGKAESLNAAVASGILLYEAVRQRIAAGGCGL